MPDATSPICSFCAVRDDDRVGECMTSEGSAPSFSRSPGGGGRSAITTCTIPSDFVPYVAQLEDHLRCDDCGGFITYASLIGIPGRFCSCPFDREHP